MQEPRKNKPKGRGLKKKASKVERKQSLVFNSASIKV
jgi:hypothetical protein